MTSTISGAIRIAFADLACAAAPLRRLATVGRVPADVAAAVEARLAATVGST